MAKKKAIRVKEIDTNWALAWADAIVIGKSLRQALKAGDASKKKRKQEAPRG